MTKTIWQYVTIFLSVLVVTYGLATNPLILLVGIVIGSVVYHKLAKLLEDER